MRNAFLICLLFAFEFHDSVLGVCAKKPLKVVKKGNSRPRKICVLQLPGSRGKVEILLGSKVRTPNCLECECKEKFILCCTKEAPSKDSVPSGCKVIREHCEYRTVKSDNSSIDCVQPTPPTTTGFSNLIATTDAFGSAFNTISPADPFVAGNSLSFQDPPLPNPPPSPTVQARPSVQLSTGSSIILALANVLGQALKPSPWGGGGWFGGKQTFMGQEVEGESFRKNPMLAMAVMNNGGLTGTGSQGGAGGLGGLMSGIGSGLGSALGTSMITGSGSTGSTGTGLAGLFG